MQQILMNYIGNAIKFTTKGTIVIVVRLLKDAEFRNLGVLKIEVIDSGCGISKENQKRLFRPFTMLSESRSMNPNGTGLGLSICKRIAESLGGRVAVNSSIDLGSTFEFTF